ncbi:MAG: hypothetical protein IPJ81_17845 [Chitinophagaceae bacterium]|nr:hypothetical protein [Chitinophagaceae bacterium]
MNKLKYLLFLVVIISPLFVISQDNDIDKRLIGKWKFTYVEDENSSKDNFFLVKAPLTVAYNDAFLVINIISEKEVNLEYWNNKCLGITRIDSTSCSISNNKISLYVRDSYWDNKVYSESREKYEILSIDKDSIKLKGLEKKMEYF